MDLITATEIVNNPHDLFLVITKTKQPGSNSPWHLAVSRGPSHNFKPLSSSDQPEKLQASREDALYIIEVCVLYLALARVQIPQGDKSLERLNDAEGRDALKGAMREAIEKSKPLFSGCLTLPFVDRIMAELSEKGECMTSEMEPTSQELVDACREVLSQEDRNDLGEMPFDEAVGHVFTLLIENGIEDPESFLKKKGILE